MPSDQLIWVASWSHNPHYGVKLYAAPTSDALYAVIAVDCLKSWPKGLRKPRGDGARVEAYFKWHAEHDNETLFARYIPFESMPGAAE